MTKRIKLLIPNAPGKSNLGDLAIYQASINTIKRELPNARIIIHAMDYDGRVRKNKKPSIYYWSAFQDRSFLGRIKRMPQLLIMIGLNNYKFGKFLFGKTLLYALVNDYFESDLIFFIGGGFLRSSPGLKQALNLMMDFITLYLSNKTAANIIVGPVSFGPFAYKWQEKLGVWSLRKADYVIVREDVSYRKLKPFLTNSMLMADHALHINKQSGQKQKQENVIGFTIREWLPKADQAEFEKMLALALEDFCQKYNFSLQPVIQVSDQRYEYDDRPTKNVISNIDFSKVKIFPMIKPSSIRQACRVYGKLSMLLGMRMHSNILALTQHVPVAAISYEYKTEGIMKYLSLDKYCISISKVTKDKLTNLLGKVYENRTTIRKEIQSTLSKIKNEENLKWRIIFESVNI